MIRIAFALIITLSILLFMGCNNDPINSNYGDETSGVGEFKTDTINVSYEGNFNEEQLPVKYLSASASHLVLMNKKGVKTRVVINIPFIKPDVNHTKAELYFESIEYTGPDFGTAECNVYLMNEQWDSTLTQNELWQTDYQSFFDPSPIGTLTISSADSINDTLRFNPDNLVVFDQIADTSLDVANNGFLIDLPEGISDEFVKAYKAYATGSGPKYYFEYKYKDEGVDDPDTTTYNSSTKTLLNYVVIEDNSSDFFNYDDDNYYYLKTYNPTHLWVDVPFLSLENKYAGKNVSFLAANLYIPIDSSKSYYEEFHDNLAIFPAEGEGDPLQITRVTRTSENKLISISVSGWDSTGTYMYNSSIPGQRDLGNLLLMEVLEDKMGDFGWLVEPYTFNRFFQVYAVDRNKTPYLVIKYYERPNPRF